MRTDSPRYNEGSSLFTGVKTVALIVILGVIAAVADHAFFIAPYRSAKHVMDAAPSVMAPSPSGAFAIPENLRTNAGEVPEHVRAF